jgi:hypothetical protein
MKGFFERWQWSATVLLNLSNAVLIAICRAAVPSLFLNFIA